MTGRNGTALLVALALLRTQPACGEPRPVPRVEMLDTQPEGPSVTEFHLRITNWQQFPHGELTTPPALPPNPCKMANAPQRLWLEVMRVDGPRVSCGPVTRKTLRSFSFHDYKGQRPQIIIVLTDIKTNATWRSQPIDTSKQ